MNSDIRPPQRPPRPPDSPPPRYNQPDYAANPVEQAQTQQPSLVQQADPTEQSPQLPPIVDTDNGKSPARKPAVWKIALSIIGAIILVALLAIGWYAQAQQPVQPGETDMVSVTIEPGLTPSQIGSLLYKEKLIKSELAFTIYTRINGVESDLKAGDYRLSPSDNLETIVAQLQQGQSNQFKITFYPGATLFDPTDISDKKRTDVYTMLRRAGYGDSEVRQALKKNYDHPLLADKPAGTTLEGYVYGDTYQFNSGTPVEDVLVRTFDEFYKHISGRQLIDKLEKQKLTLYEGITLASIIEREVSGRIEDQKQVSQIFHLRLDQGTMLGADATFMYAAQQQNQSPTINFDSPYNTRKYAGLPPGPISSPNITALEAAADPAPGDYFYFVSGDDGKTHFARTEAEHEENTRKYCTDLCYSIE